ncbi:MAG TPA: YybS family protein [Calditerricola sp.]
MSVRAVVEGAVALALYAVMLALSAYTPLGLFLSLVLPLPFAVYAARQGWQPSAWTAVLALVLTAFLFGLPAVPAAVFAGAVGTALGGAHRKRRPAEQAVLLAFLAALISMLLLFVALAVLFEINLVERFDAFVRESLLAAERMLEQAGLDVERQAAMWQESERWFHQLLPSMLLMSAATVALVNQWAAGHVLRRMGVSVRRLAPLKDWRLPRSLLYYYLASIVLLLVPGVRDVTWLANVAWNGQALLSVLFVVQGLSLVFFLADARGWSPWVGRAVVILLFLFPHLFLILSLAGIVDLATRVRDVIRG